MNSHIQPTNCSTTSIFYKDVEACMVTAQPNEYALVSMDIDNFKYINDLFGYEIGDKTLDFISSHFDKFLAEDELFARVNADNFLFLLKLIEGCAILDRLSQIGEIGCCLHDLLPAHYNFVVSGGIFYIDNPREKVATMVDKANFARKQAKGNHISTFLSYTQEMSDELNWKKEITLSMESALKNKEFEMYLQPKILLKTGKVIGAEALARWHNAANGLIQPDRFIPVLEQNGFIKQLDFYMLEQACLFLKKCLADNLPILPISVNFSRVHIGTPDFVDQVFQMVLKHQIAPKLIEIELTESVFTEDFQALVDITGGLQRLGFQVSLDDFGSAYSSLGYLKDFPVDTIKIDKSFLESGTNSDKGRLVISKTMEMIQSLNLTTVMEGVENKEQVLFLQKLNCDIGQGYYYAKPMPTDAYEAFIKTHSDRPNEVKDKGQEMGGCFEELNGDLLSTNLLHSDCWETAGELDTLYDTIAGGVIHCDEDGKIRYHNEGFRQLIGYDEKGLAENLGNNIINLVLEEDRDWVRAQREKLVLNDQPKAIKFRIKCKDGRVVWVLEQGKKIKTEHGLDQYCCVVVALPESEG